MPSHFHSAVKSFGSSAAKILFLDRVAEHHRAERRGVDVDRPFGAAFHPGEQRRVGRREPVPDKLHLVRLFCAQRRNRGFGKPRRDADAQRAGDELEQRPARGLVERIEPGGKLRGQLGFAERRQCGDDMGEGGGVRRAARRGHAWRGPHQRHRLRQVAHVIVGQREQHRLGALGDQRADDAGLGVAERERAGDRRERVAAIRIGRFAEIIRQQPQLGVAAGLIGEAIEQRGEAVHASAPVTTSATSSSSP